MVVKATAYVASQPDPVKQRRNARQAVYQQTENGKDKNRRAKLKWRYGITADQYDWMHRQQEGTCYVCGLVETVPHPETGKLKRLGVDHDHACDRGHDPKRGCTFCVRGLACYNCNIFMARVERSVLLRPRFEDLLARRPLLAGNIT